MEHGPLCGGMYTLKQGEIVLGKNAMLADQCCSTIPITHGKRDTTFL